MEYEVTSTEVFTKWVKKLKDRHAAKAIALRIDRASLGNLGDVKSVGEGVFEMRIFVGKGYRVYFLERGGRFIILLCGGDKSSQKRDIQRAKEMVRLIERQCDEH